MQPSNNAKIRRLIGVFLSSLLFTVLCPLSAFATTLYFYPQNISLMPGEEVLVDIRIDTGTTTINAVELEGALSGVSATLRGIQSSGSAVDIFVEKPNVKGKNNFRLVGGIPAGLTGDHMLARLLVRGELSGSAMLSFVPMATKALVADGSGSSAPMQFGGATIRVLPKAKDPLVLTSDSHPDQNQWYADNRAQIRFNFDPNASYSYLVTRDGQEVPDDTADTPEGTATWDGGVKLEQLPEGISYFAIKKVGDQVVSRYRFMIDAFEPLWVEVNQERGTIETEGRPFLTFLARDDVSGVEYYEVRINGGEPFTVSSPFPLPDEYTVLSLRAYDKAGNFIEQFIPGPKKDFSLWVWAAVLFVLLVWVSGIISDKKVESRD